MRVAIAGAGAVGRSIARELIGNGHDVLLIDKEPASIKPERVPSARTVRDAELVEDIKTAHKANLGVYGARKIHAELNREGVRIARCTVERLMRGEGLCGIPREKTRKTTIGDGAETDRPEDLVKRKFIATGPIHHSDRGVQYRAIRYTERLAEAEAVAFVGSRGDSYDNAMAEALNSLFKAECIRNPAMRPRGGWKSVSDVEIAVAEYVDWLNHRRLHGEIGLVPPAEFEANHWATSVVTDHVETPVPTGAGSK